MAIPTVFAQITDVLVVLGISPLDYWSLVPYMSQTPNATTIDLPDGRQPKTNETGTLIRASQRALAALGKDVTPTGKIDLGTDLAMQGVIGVQWKGALWSVVLAALANKLRQRGVTDATYRPPASAPMGIPLWAWGLGGLGVVLILMRR